MIFLFFLKLSYHKYVNLQEKIQKLLGFYKKISTPKKVSFVENKQLL